MIKEILLFLSLISPIFAQTTNEPIVVDQNPQEEWNLLTPAEVEYRQSLFFIYGDGFIKDETKPSLVQITVR